MYCILYNRSSNDSGISVMRMVLCKLRMNTEYFHSQFRRPAAKTWVPEVARKNEIENSMGNGTLNSTKCVCVAIFLGSYLGFTVHTECVYSFVLIANIAPAKRSRILFHAIHYTFVYCKCILCVSLRLELMLPTASFQVKVSSFQLFAFSFSLYLCHFVLCLTLCTCVWKCVFFLSMKSYTNTSPIFPSKLFERDSRCTLIAPNHIIIIKHRCSQYIQYAAG